MKKQIFRTIVYFIAITSTLSITAQKFDRLNKSPMDASSYPTHWKKSNKIAKVIYSRPQLKGRKVSRLAKHGKVWRTGANEATEITFYKDVVFAGKPVKAGTYSLFSIPNKKEWIIILNNELNVWGSFFYKESEDVVRIKGKVSTSKKPVEAFSISFDGKDNDFTMYFGWGTTVVAVPIKVEEKISEKK